MDIDNAKLTAAIDAASIAVGEMKAFPTWDYTPILDDYTSQTYIREEWEDLRYRAAETAVKAALQVIQKKEDPIMHNNSQHTPASRRQWVQYDDPIGAVHLHMRNESFYRFSAAQLSTSEDLHFESAQHWFNVANNKPGGFCFL